MGATLELRTLMKKGLLYSIVVIFFFLTPICFIAANGLMVSLKYEVDEAHIFAEINKKTTNAEKIQRHQSIDEREKKLNFLFSLWTSSLVLFPTTATGLLIFKNKFIRGQKATMH